MVENEDGNQGMNDSGGTGQARRHVTREQARIIAIKTAQDNPADCGRRFADVRMLFAGVEQEEMKNSYFVTLSFRPAGDFRGTPGKEQFVIEKEGAVAGRKVQSLPRDWGQDALFP